MSTSTTWLRQLEAYLQEEIGAQGRLIALLEEQERALLSHSRLAIESASHALQAQFAASSSRSRRREDLVARLAQSWGVAPQSLTLASIAERAGSDGERLARQRSELQRATRKAQRLARRTAAAARLHSRLSNEIVRACLGADTLSPKVDAGAVVDAEA